MTNFGIFLSETKFALFAEVSVSAEKILNIDPAACVLNYHFLNKTQFPFVGLTHEHIDEVKQ